MSTPIIDGAQGLVCPFNGKAGNRLYFEDMVGFGSWCEVVLGTVRAERGSELGYARLPELDRLALDQH